MNDIELPFSQPPAFGEPVEIANRIHWLRLPLPFRLDHVNVYLFEDGDGWTILDAGTDTATVRSHWLALLEGPLSHRPVRRLIVSHFHPDHVGAAAFLCERTGADLWMNETEYLTARFMLRASEEDAARERAFYRAHGLAGSRLEAVGRRHQRYRNVVPDLPATYRPVREGDRLTLAGRHVEAHILAGHAPAQLLLHAPDDGLFFAADHVMAKISPNVSVAEDKPEDDPLGLYLASFKRLTTLVSDRALVLPGHRLPFIGLHRRMAQLASHHAERCQAILAACPPATPLTVAEIVPVLFPVALDDHQFWFAFAETAAHVNLMARRGQIREERDEAGLRRWHAAAG